MAPEEPGHGHREALAPEPDVTFCGYCGQRPADDATVTSRVCHACQMGLLLRAPSHSAPTEHETFLIVDDLLRIRAVSRGAERLLGLHETQLVDGHVGEVLVPAEATLDGSARLAALIARVASRAETGASAHTIAVRPRDMFGVRYAARIGPCWPEPAALVVLGDPL